MPGASQVALLVKNPPANAGELRDSGSVFLTVDSLDGEFYLSQLSHVAFFFFLRIVICFLILATIPPLKLHIGSPGASDSTFFFFCMIGTNDDFFLREAPLVPGTLLCEGSEQWGLELWAFAWL